MRLANKVTLVTGGGSGIGAAICERFAEEGATVVVGDIQLDSAEREAAAIRKRGGNAVAIQQDATDDKRWQEVVKQILAEYGQLDVLVNNAGIVIPASVEDCTLEDWRKTQAVNGESVYLGTQAAIGIMKNAGGSIINISSIDGIVGEPLGAAYNYSKGGVRIFTKSAALHCSAQGYPVRINSVHPGFVLTPLLENGAKYMSPEQAEAFQARVLASIPMGRMGEPREIAHGCLFLASDESSYMTGSELVIDGGYTAK